MQKKVILFIFGFLLCNCFGQNLESEWLRGIYKDVKRDKSIRIKALQKLTAKVINENLDSAYKLSEIQLNLARESNNRLYVAEALNSIGACMMRKGEVKASQGKFYQALKLFQAGKNKQGIARTYTNLGVSYTKLANDTKALEYLLLAANTCEGCNTKEQTIYFSNLGEFYNTQGDHVKAISYFNKSYNIACQQKDSAAIRRIYACLGGLYLERKNLARAEFYIKSGINLSKSLHDQRSLASGYEELARLCFQKELWDSAYHYYNQALIIEREIGAAGDEAALVMNLGCCCISKKEYKKAVELVEQSLSASIKLKDLAGCENAYFNLSGIYDSLNQPVLALKYYKSYITCRDSLNLDEQSEKFAQVELRNENEKQALRAKQLQDRIDLKVEQDKQRYTWLTISSTGFLVMISMFAYIVYKNLHKSRQQKQIIEEKQKEIFDNISYAKRLQTALLPSDVFWERHLPNSFVLYKPKDVVSGDFYWMEKQSDMVFLAAADCTGHGVSGAMVSVVCCNALNRAVKEFNIISPDLILNKVRDLVLETFEKGESVIKDGMDISLCCLNTRTNELLWAGANNPLWYIHENSLLEIKPNKQPIGANDQPRPFTLHKIYLEKGDSVYLFTDGYADQFGGEKGKKFMYKPLKNLLLSLFAVDMDKQKDILDKHFENWRGDMEQTDDVLLIGFTV